MLNKSPKNFREIYNRIQYLFKQCPIKDSFIYGVDISGYYYDRCPPPVGGVEIISVAALLAMLGASTEALILHIVIDPIVDLFATLIAASSENMLDRKIFNY